MLWDEHLNERERFYGEYMQKTRIDCVETAITADGLHYGKYVVEPLDRGYGITLGNSLRRVLLSSLEAAAIVSVRFEGVPHEFTSVDGVSEDVLDIALNLKKVILRYHGTGVKELTLRSNSKTGSITAADFEADADIEIINPDQHIATVTKKGALNAIVKIEKGVGYNPANIRAARTKTIGDILIDAVFTPVRKVNYTVEETRVGQDTDFDKLNLEIWTDGSVEPSEALTHSSKILIEQLTLFTDLENNRTVEEGAEGDELEFDMTGLEDIDESILKLPIEGLDLSARAKNALTKSSISLMGHLLSRSRSDLLAIKNFGSKTADEIEEKLTELGYSLKKED